MSAPTSLASTFLNAVKNRRTIYNLGKKEVVPDSEIISLIKEIVKESPSSFNSQTSRVLFLVGKEHENYWRNTISPAIKAAVPEDAFEKLNGRTEANAKGRLTALFFESQATIADWQEKQPVVKDIFPEWSGHQSGIAQINAWTAVSAAGLGANLQHHGCMFLGKKLNQQYGIPEDWKLQAELAIGSKEADAGQKSYMDDEQRFKVLGL